MSIQSRLSFLEERAERRRRRERLPVEQLSDDELAVIITGDASAKPDTITDETLRHLAREGGR